MASRASGPPARSSGASLARMVSTPSTNYPSRHEADPVRLPRPGRIAEPDWRASQHPAVELLRPDRSPDARQDCRRSASRIEGAGETEAVGRRNRAARAAQGFHWESPDELDPVPKADATHARPVDRALRAQNF